MIKEKYRLIRTNEAEEVLQNIEITKYEFAQALIMHNRLKQKKTR